MVKVQSKITVETNESLIIKYRRIFLRTWCPHCSREAGMVSPFDAGILIGKDQQAVCNLMKDGSLHHCRLEDGRSFICINSLCYI